VGAPYFNAIAIPIGIGLLFLMAIAPVLSWRHASFEVMVHRLELPAWAATITVALLVAFGVRGFLPLSGFFLGAFAASSALRTLLLDVRAERRRGASGVRAIAGRSGGGMIVHLGVVVLAVGIVASTSYATRGEIVLPQGQVVHFAGHSFEFVGMETISTPVKTQTLARIKVDNSSVFSPGVSQFAGRSSQPVGTPAIDSGTFGDVYLTLDGIGSSQSVSGSSVIQGLAPGSIALGVIVEPLLPWLWAGGLIVGVGGVLAMVPERRRRRAEDELKPQQAEAVSQ
jgi:cytochrome c-type biogenesis protein CcmF